MATHFAMGDGALVDELDQVGSREEGIGGSHEAAIQHAPDTKLTIKDEARRLLRAQRERSL